MLEISVKANPTHIQQAFEKKLSMKVNELVIARNSTGNTNIMNQQSGCGHQIYVEVAHSQR